MVRRLMARLVVAVVLLGAGVALAQTVDLGMVQAEGARRIGRCRTAAEVIQVDASTYQVRCDAGSVWYQVSPQGDGQWFTHVPRTGQEVIVD